MSWSKAKQLGETLGGKWTYDGRCCWWCDDNRRHVCRCSAGLDEFDNEVGPAQYWLYGDTKHPGRAEGYILRRRKPKTLMEVFFGGQHIGTAEIEEMTLCGK